MARKKSSKSEKGSKTQEVRGLARSAAGGFGRAGWPTLKPEVAGPLEVCWMPGGEETVTGEEICARMSTITHGQLGWMPAVRLQKKNKK
jgi:hypothetical protein